MEIRVLVIQVTCMFVLNVSGNIYTLKHICPPELTKTLRKYDCVYYGPSVTSTSGTKGGGIISECCQNMCTEYYLVTSYCKRSTIDNFVTERSEVLNVITKDRGEFNDIRRIEEDDVTEKVVDNMVLKETTKATIYKPAVFVLSKITPNSPIPVPRRNIYRR